MKVEQLNRETIERAWFMGRREGFFWGIPIGILIGIGAVIIQRMIW